MLIFLIDIIVTPQFQEVIIKALHRAIEHFEEWNKLRMVTYITVMIADEYSDKLDPMKAQALYTKSLAVYAKDKWTTLEENIRTKLACIEEAPDGPTDVSTKE